VDKHYVLTDGNQKVEFDHAWCVFMRASDKQGSVELQLSAQDAREIADALRIMADAVDAQEAAE